MQPLLARKLIDKGAIRQGTEFEAYHTAPYLSSLNTARVVKRFVIHAARVLGDGSVAFDAYVDPDPTLYRLSCSDVLSIDGMDEKRFAGIYALTVAGDDIAQGKRRGRRPKKLIAEMAAAAAAAQAASSSKEAD